MAQTYGERWEVKESLAEGGQAHTFLVKDLKGAGEVSYVLKRLKNPKRIDRFKSELEAVRSISAPGMLKVIDFDLDASKPYFVSEYCSAGALGGDSRILTAPLAEKIAAFSSICDAVEAAHKQKIVHRDIKPDNIFIRGDGSLALGDFGLCYIDGGEDRATGTIEAVGSRLFIAPEAEDGRQDTVEPSADIYSLGKVLYWLLSGGNLFSREKHRDPAFDLAVLHGTTENPDRGWEHFSVVLDHMIVENANSRWDVSKVREETNRAERLVSLEYASVLSSSEASRCRHCGQGDYIKCPDMPVNFGIEPRGMAHLRIRVCNWCGHVALFRPDYTALHSPARTTIKS